MEPWLIERLRQEEQEREQGEPLHIEPPQRPAEEAPAEPEDGTERGVWIVDL